MLQPLKGGASGIGLETVKAFLEADALGVTLVDSSPIALSKAADALKPKYHERLLIVQSDVTDEVSIQIGRASCRERV